MFNYDYRLKTIIDRIVGDIQNIEMDLRCCGNCLNYNAINTCSIGMQSQYVKDHAFKRCSKWTFDNLTYAERTVSQEGCEGLIEE